MIGANMTEARRVNLGNLLFRILGCLIVAPLLPYIEDLFVSWSLSDGQIAVYFHLLFNMALGVVFIGFAPMLGRLMDRWLPVPAPPAAPPIRFGFGSLVLELPKWLFESLRRS